MKRLSAFAWAVMFGGVLGVSAAEGLTNWVAVVNDLNLQFKVFSAAGEGGAAALGFRYDFEKSLAGRDLLDGKKDKLAISLNAVADGNVAFNSNKNPNNLLNTGGELKLQNEHRFESASEDALTFPLFYSRLKARARMESDQSFETRQMAYGAAFGFTFLDLEKQSFHNWNVLDYPFAFTRWITAPDAGWSVDGDFPVVLVGLDLIDPQEDNARFTVDPNESTYNRLSAELAYTTTVTTVKGADVKFGAAHRYFKELSPSRAIRNAEFDEQNYFVAYLEYRSFVLSWSTGRLPVDRENDRVFGLGYRLQF